MSKPPIVSQASRLVRATLAGTPADQVLRAALPRDRRFAAPGPWREVSRAVFAYFRWLRWLDERASLPRQIDQALDLQHRFERNPAALKPETLAARAVPDWLKLEMAALPAGWLRTLQREPGLWIRARTGHEADVARALGHCTAAAPPAFRVPPTALRYTGTTDLFRTAPFQAGRFEIQDLASQLAGHACAPQPGEIWWDACAGEGGKTLHLSDLMQNKGLIWATDRSARRLRQLRDRAARAGMFNYRTADWDGDARLPTRTKFNGILVDAPCSGVGTWQRNPHARWTTTPADVRELAGVQTRLLAHAAPALKPGGRLVYAVCTLTRSETVAVADAFTAAHPDFAPSPVFAPPPSAHGAQPAPRATPTSDLCLSSSVLLWPHEIDANGMFLAAWTRK